MEDVVKKDKTTLSERNFDYVLRITDAVPYIQQIYLFNVIRRAPSPSS